MTKVLVLLLLSQLVLQCLASGGHDSGHGGHGAPSSSGHGDAHGGSGGHGDAAHGDGGHGDGGHGGGGHGGGHHGPPHPGYSSSPVFGVSVLLVAVLALLSYLV